MSELDETEREQLRDMFAMAALISPHAVSVRVGENRSYEHVVAAKCYRLADAMIEARKQPAQVFDDKPLEPSTH